MKKYILPLLFVVASITACKTPQKATTKTSAPKTEKPVNRVQSVNNYDVK